MLVFFVEYDVRALNPGQLYIAPEPSQVNDCVCNTVYYSLIGACGTCQNSPIVPYV